MSAEGIEQGSPAEARRAGSGLFSAVPGTAADCCALASAPFVASSRCRCSRKFLSRDDVGKGLDRIRIIEKLQDLVDLYARGVEPHRPRHPRPPDLAGDLERHLRLNVAELVVQELEIVRVDADVDRADLPFVYRKLPRDRQLLSVVIEQLELLDPHDIGLQLDASSDL